MALISVVDILVEVRLQSVEVKNTITSYVSFGRVFSIIDILDTLLSDVQPVDHFSPGN